MLKKPDVLPMLIKNFNENVNRNIMDTDLMFNFRHGLLGKQHTVLKNKPDALLLQLYIDDIGLTNPIGAKKDTQKVTMIYFQLEDLPDTIKSILNSIGVVAMCHSNYLTNKLNRKKFFDPIVADLNALQIDGIFIPTLQTHLHFAFTVVTGDHLASNDIGGFQKIFNTGEFCRHCHVNYNQKLVPLNEITHRRRIQDQHNNLVQQVTNLNNNVTLHGVVGASPLVNLIGFHAVTSLPNDPMHDFNEGVCGQLIMAMLKEASTKRLLTYGDIENRLLAFEYGDNDKSNKPPILRKKHLKKGKIVGTASQKMLFFKLFPIIFYDFIDQLETKEIYICLREIVSLVFACSFRKSWLSYLHSLCIRFQCLMVHLLPHMVTPKIHFVTDYAKQIEMNGPAIRHWCMRFESKHQIFKRLAVKSNNFKNILYTLSKRNQLHQCLLLSFSNYYTIVNEGYSVSERDLCTLPIDILTGDHLASNDIGGFQKIFNTGEFCRHFHINYNQKLVPSNKITHRRRIQDQHNNFVQQVTNLNNNVTLHGVVGASPLVNLIDFHAVTSLPNDSMHDFNEGVCDQLLMAMLKEALTKRLLTYGDIENRLLAFEYGDNDKSNKPPILRKKHLKKGKIVDPKNKFCVDPKNIFMCLLKQ
ncbi:unnamed protein product [Adineta steineri]|uniref:Uncharacterized protein n=1 Tax=Adineta steineri TaxID=433720 RepID=A0A815PRN0_9BILA|nr:unnamed protein product [Adineta steineri]